MFNDTANFSITFQFMFYSVPDILVHKAKKFEANTL